MRPLRIIHCANFNTVRLKGCYMASMGYKLNNGLVRLGHQVLTYSDRDMARLFGIFGKKCFLTTKKNNDNFYKFCLNLKPDIIFLGHADTISADTLLKVREKLPNIKILQWNVDAINPVLESGRRNIKNIQSKLAAVDYTLITTAERKLYAPFNPDKNNIGFIPNPVDKSIETARVFENSSPEYDVFFASNPDAERDIGGKLLKAKEIAAMLEKNCPNTKLMFPRLNAPSADGIAYLNLIAKSAMVLNLSRISEDYLYSSDRMAHAMGNGCLAFIDRRTGFTDIFNEDEAAFYEGQDELVDKINFYKQNPLDRMGTAQKGWKKYHELFNETKVASYALSLLDGSFKKENYPFARYR